MFHADKRAYCVCHITMFHADNRAYCVCLRTMFHADKRAYCVCLRTMSHADKRAYCVCLRTMFHADNRAYCVCLRTMFHADKRAYCVCLRTIFHADKRAYCDTLNWELCIILRNPGLILHSTHRIEIWAMLIYFNFFADDPHGHRHKILNNDHVTTMSLAPIGRASVKVAWGCHCITLFIEHIQ